MMQDRSEQYPAPFPDRSVRHCKYNMGNFATQIILVIAAITAPSNLHSNRNGYRRRTGSITSNENEIVKRSMLSLTL